MTCAEFQQVLPEMIDGEARGEHALHLRACRNCSSLVADLRAIASGAKLLCAADEPSPRVWANLERTLETEGLIRTPQQVGGVLTTPSRSWWFAAWLVPAMAMLVLGIAMILRNSTATLRQNAEQVSPQTVLSAQPRVAAVADVDEEPLLGHMSPAARARYEDSLRTVNAFIQDAQASLNANPDDEVARHFLMDAYAQKAMVYELAMDRSLQ
jgi:hypothetical protein